jgi:hypothetical protein
LASSCAISHVVTSSNSRKGFTHGIGRIPFLRRDIVIDNDFWTVTQELVLEKLVSDEPLGQDHDKVQLFTKEEPESIGIVFVMQVFLNEKII